MAAADIHFTGEVNVNSFKPDPKQLEALAAAADEGRKVGVDVAVHAASVVAMLAAVKAGVPKLVHTPHFQWMTDADAQAVKAAGLHVSRVDGSPLRYNNRDPYLPDLLIAPKSMAGRVLELMKSWEPAPG